MNYEQKYKEALEKLREFLRDYKNISHLVDVKEELESIFPELRESEDERIRKEIIELVHFFYCSSSVYEHHVSEDDMIAWLEKQDEKPSWSEEDEKMWLQVINEIEAIKSNSSTIFEKNIAQDKINWLKSIKPNH